MAEGTTAILIDMVRKQCLIRGFEGIKGLGLAFRNLDIDLSKKIVYDELKDGLKGYGIIISEENLKILFKALDKDGSGEIDFQEFLKTLSPPMNERRKEVVNMAFNALDTNNDGVLRHQDLAKVSHGDYTGVMFLPGGFFLEQVRNRSVSGNHGGFYFFKGRVLIVEFDKISLEQLCKECQGVPVHLLVRR